MRGFGAVADALPLTPRSGSLYLALSFSLRSELRWCQRLDEVRTTNSLELNRSCSQWGFWVILRKTMRWWGEFSRNQLKSHCDVFLSLDVHIQCVLGQRKACVPWVLSLQYQLLAKLLDRMADVYDPGNSLGSCLLNLPPNLFGWTHTASSDKKPFQYSMATPMVTLFSPRLIKYSQGTELLGVSDAVFWWTTGCFQHEFNVYLYLHQDREEMYVLSSQWFWKDC